jgi:DNA-binding Lrp family transcriptional regulator
VTKLSDRILEILRGCPYGLTAKEIAEHLGVPVGNISSRLSKLAAYGIIKRTRGRIAHNVSACAIYHAPTSVPSSKALLMNQTSTATPLTLPKSYT